MCENICHSNNQCMFMLCFLASFEGAEQTIILPLLNHFAQGLVIFVQTIINKEIKIYHSIFIHKTKKEIYF